jgi:GntR family transcriptional regulator
VSDLLRHELARSPREGPLPSEGQLALSYGASRNAIREALDRLRTEGLVQRLPGAGTFPIVRLGGQRLDLSDGFAESLHSPQIVTEVITAETRSAPTSVTRTLGMAAGEQAVLIERRASVDGIPVLMSTTWLPASIAGGVLDLDLTQEICGLVESLGVPLLAIELDVEAVAAHATDAVVLQTPTGAPLLLITMSVRRTDGRQVELSFLRCVGSRVRLAPLPIPLGADA